jgi:hypothetical protein
MRPWDTLSYLKVPPNATLYHEVTFMAIHWVKCRWVPSPKKGEKKGKERGKHKVTITRCSVYLSLPKRWDRGGSSDIKALLLRLYSGSIQALFRLYGKALLRVRLYLDSIKTLWNRGGLYSLLVQLAVRSQDQLLVYEAWSYLCRGP